MYRFRIAVALAASLFCSWMLASAQTREEKVRADREKVVGDGFWIYNDLPAARRQAESTGKPILVVLRCIPCEECVKLDDELVDQHPVIRPLLEKFVCVRQVSTNGLDLDTFQYDTDQSFAVFMLNADGTIYGRFGTRSHRTQWLGDVSLEGLAAALRGALALHQAYPENRTSLAGKRGEPLEVASPEQYPTLKDKYSERLNYKGNVVKSCIHCHQIGEARRDYYWTKGEPIPDRLMFPYPHPKSVGMIMDPDKKATIRKVVPGSAAAKAGLQADDVIESFNGQPPLSIADLQWVLHQIDPSGGEVPMQIVRDGSPKQITFRLDDGWREAGDISWRVSTWSMRRIATGGLVLQAIDDSQKKELGLADDSMALSVEHVGQYNAHAAAKRAGFREGDLIIAYDGRNDLTSEAELIHYAVDHHEIGDSVSVTVLRDGKRKQLQLPIQK